MTAVEAAREVRAGRRKLDAAELLSLADQDADELFDKLPEAELADIFAGWRELREHLDRPALAGAIYRHALIEAGIIINRRRGRAYDPCPRCGHRFEDDG